IWATWCVPCRVEMPAIERLYQDLSPRGLRVVAVSIDEGNGDDVRAFVKEYGLSFDILHDPVGRIQAVYQTTGVPETFLLDKDGVIVKKIIGPHPWSSPANQRIVADLLGGD
ncbi:MAG TPA: TlpA disulfide reductase family protein, partial [Gemmatimonadales bacterium]|nr:TlpA disulfide reductase family protein [Gemmatimonadales bacterium]